MRDTKENQTSEFSSINLLRYIIKWRKHILIVMAITIVTSAGISYLIQPRYKSTAIFFPAKNASISKGLMTSDEQSKNDISTFGEEEQAEAMVQILNSNKIRWHLWSKYDMMTHYGIKSDAEFANSELSKKWDNNVSFSRTEFNSIRIDVLDTDKEMAAILANEILDMVDSLRNDMIHERAKHGYLIIKEELENLKAYIGSVQDSLSVIGAKGVQNYNVQVEMISGLYYESIKENNTHITKILEQKLDTLAKYGSISLALTERLELLQESFVLLHAKYTEVKVDATQSITWKFIVNRAVASEKKEYPIRWLIVMTSTFAVLILIIIVIIALEKYDKYRDLLKK